MRLDPDPACLVVGKYQGLPYTPVFLGTIPQPVPNSCFTVTVRGPLGFVTIGSGSAGLTLEGLFNPLTGGASATPGLMSEQGLAATPGAETRRLFTARTALTLNGVNGTLYTADAGEIFNADAPNPKDQLSTEQLVITGGSGAWLNATGILTASGSIIQNWAPFSGKVCGP